MRTKGIIIIGIVAAVLVVLLTVGEVLLFKQTIPPTIPRLIPQPTIQQTKLSW